MYTLVPGGRHKSIAIMFFCVVFSDLFNLRGSDIEYNPVFFSYAAVTQEEAVLFINKSQLTGAALEALNTKDGKVTVRPYEDLAKFISEQVCFKSYCIAEFNTFTLPVLFVNIFCSWFIIITTTLPFPALNRARSPRIEKQESSCRGSTHMPS